MTKQASFKQRVRARMARTGESYTTARGNLLPQKLAWMRDALHVSNGDATDLAGTGLAERILYWRDTLHEGPVPAVADDELRRIRSEFLHSAGHEAADVFAERDRELAANRDGEYVLWFEADLYDQLQIVQVLARLAGLGVPARRVTLICIGEHAGIARFGGLGELTAGQLAQLPTTNASSRLTPAALTAAVEAWAAFRSPTPDGLRAVADARSGELRFLGEAFDRLSREYPSNRDGLSLTERRLLAAISDGPNDGPNDGRTDGGIDAGTAFVRAAARETRPFLGDTWAFAMMDRMAHAPVPLLAADTTDVDHTTVLRLTDAGRRVLGGDTDHVALNGIDRWIGGVHLRGREIPWRWDDGTETIVSVDA